jgi:ABC-type Na+ efflux pump permease subunit
MVSALELTEEVLERLRKVLKGVTVVPHTVLEYRADRSPPSVSRFILHEYFMSFFLLLTLLFFGCL